MNRHDLLEQVISHKWFHAINFGDRSSTGRFSDDVPPNYTLFPVFSFLEDIDIADKKCLDIGAMDGLVSFILKQEGAASVTAVDLALRPQLLLARKILGLDVDYVTVSITDRTAIIDRFGKYGFDLIVMSGVIYHLTAPLAAILTCRQLLKENGLLIIESAYLQDEKPALYLNTESDPPFNKEPYTYFIPSPPAIEGMLKFASFDIICQARLSIHRRIAYLARATKPSYVRNRTNQLVSAITPLLLKRSAFFADIDFHELEYGTSPCSDIEYRGYSKNTIIDPYKFTTSFTLQPSFCHKQQGDSR